MFKRFDKRLLRIDASPTSLLTKDKKNLVIDVYARYKIVDLLFFQAIGNELQAESARDIVNSRLRDEVAQDNQEEIIAEVREEIMSKVIEPATSLILAEMSLLNLENGLNNNLVVIDLVANTLDGTSRQQPNKKLT